MENDPIDMGKTDPVSPPGGKNDRNFRDIIDGNELPTLEEAETWLILKALEKTGGNQSAAADLLKISQSTISRKLKKGISSR
jgi:transcriptional regulator with PAS, ATPase and Fis domain